MKVLSIRRITNDRLHNVFTGASRFKGDLYVAYRQGDVHHQDDSGRVIVQRSRDAGGTWDTVAVLRGDDDTRDAHLSPDGRRLYCTCYVDPTDSHPVLSGCAVTEDGDHWTPLSPMKGPAISRCGVPSGSGQALLRGMSLRVTVWGALVRE